MGPTIRGWRLDYVSPVPEISARHLGLGVFFDLDDTQGWPVQWVIRTLRIHPLPFVRFTISFAKKIH